MLENIKPNEIYCFMKLIYETVAFGFQQKDLNGYISYFETNNCLDLNYFLKNNLRGSAVEWVLFLTAYIYDSVTVAR